MNINFSKDYLIPILKTWMNNKKEEGMIPTVQMLIEDLEDSVFEPDGINLSAEHNKN